MAATNWRLHGRLATQAELSKHTAVQLGDANNRWSAVTHRYEHRLKPLLQRLVATLWGLRRWLPLASFILGLISCFLVQRQPSLVRWLAAIMLLNWLLLLAEPLIVMWIRRFTQHRLPSVLARYLTQMLHQESLFFVLPFFLSATIWLSGQALVTTLVALAALASIIDPLYYGYIVKRRWLLLGFHGFTLVVVLLTAAPLLFDLTMAQTLIIASLALAASALPSFMHALKASGWRWCAALLLSCALGLGAWLGRYWIPAVTMQTTALSISTQLNSTQRHPGQARRQFSVADLRRQGLYAFSQITAPHGLQQGVQHIWRHQGRIVDRIPLHITGSGDNQPGYRTWSHKKIFGRHPAGRWQLEIRTLDGQLLARQHFNVHA